MTASISTLKQALAPAFLNRSVEDVTAKMSFSAVPELTGKELYAESSIEGYRAVLPNSSEEATHIDLELLFNATISNSEAIKALF